MFDAFQSGITQYQLSIMFGVDANGKQKTEPDWGGNNVYLGNTGFQQVPLRKGFDWQGKALGGTALGINNAGEVGYWNIQGNQHAQWVQVLGVQGWVNSISLQAGNDFGRQTLNNPVNNNGKTIKNIRQNLRSPKRDKGE